LGLFLKKKVTIDSDNQQTPQYGRMTSQEGEFVFMYSENTVVIQDKTTDAKLDLLLSWPAPTNWTSIRISIVS
jgi:hypothetical protein